MKTELKHQWVKMGVLAAVVATALPELSFAQPASLGESVDNIVDKEITNIPQLLSGVAYILGAVLIISGSLSLKKHSENPAGEPLGKGLGRLVVGAGVAAIPALLGFIQGTTGIGTQTGAAYAPLDAITK